MNTIQAITKCLRVMDTSMPPLKRVTLYLSPKLTVKVTNPHKPSKRNTRVTVLVTVGAPNYIEKRFITACEKAGEPFPVRKPQLKAWPVKRHKRSGKSS